MASTTFTDNYQIKLIGTGLEAGTWGTSTNENLERIEQALGESASVVVTSIAGYVKTGVAPEDKSTATWITSDTANAGDALSEGRAGFVEFTSASDVGTLGVTLRVRGNTVGNYPNRIFLVKNGLSDSRDLILNCNSVDTTDTYTVGNGAYALVYTVGNSLTGSVNNALSKLQIEDLLFPGPGAATITSVGDMGIQIDGDTDIQIKADSATSLDIKDTAGTYLALSTAVDVTTTITSLARNSSKLTATGPTSNNISGISQANPAVVSLGTVMSAPFAAGLWVRITGVVGMTQVNNRLFRVVTGATTSSFTLEGVDSREYTAWSSGGDAISSTAILTVDDTAGLADNDMVEITNVVGMDELNDNYFTVDVLVGGEDGTLELLGVDVSTYDPYESAGTVTKVASELDAAVGAIDVNAPVLDASTQETNIRIKAGVESSLQIREGSNPYIDIDTRSDGIIGLKNTVISSVTDGNEDPTTDLSYLNFGRISGADGFGIRSNAGTIQTKSNSGEWGSGTVPAPGSDEQFRTARIDTASTAWELAPEQTVGGDLLENGGFLDYYLGFVTTGDPVSGSDDLDVDMTATDLEANMRVVGSDIAAGTVIVSITDANTVVISKDATGSATGQDLTISTNGTSAPNGWTAAGTIVDTYTGRFPSTTLTEGRGNILKVTPSGDETGVLSQTISNPIGSTDYLIEARIETTADAVVTLTTTGGSTNVSSVSDGAAAQTLRGIATTDSSGTNIVVKLASTAAETDPYYVYYLQARRIATTSHMNRSSSGYAVTNTSNNTARFDSNIGTTDRVPLAALFGELATSVVATSSSKRIVVDSCLQTRSPGDNRLIEMNLLQSINGGGAVEVNRVCTDVQEGDGGHHQTILVLGYVCENPIPGAVYTYTVSGSADFPADSLIFNQAGTGVDPPSHWMRVQLI